MKISIIAAIGNNNEIGQNGTLLFHISEDLKYFKSITKWNTVIMGRKTFESLPNGVLPYRRNIVLSRNHELKVNNAEVYSSLEIALKFVKKNNEVFIIGGSQLYKQTIFLSKTLYLTEVNVAFPKADVFFPIIDNKEWREMSRKKILIDDKNLYSYSFVRYERV